ncbi:hypothetical protein BDV26DRAFT_282805 [Aspergillus bertholletiae]|uniref:Uncharacterized protein n=1 Tax=Aspergillus bertholletiae TaxID=1226010 RepID=A0A5N7B2F3_9EURO|nr:hypothetical protein BDV26DRAFT_282805 [Aspergillus bertholletiae]
MQPATRDPSTIFYHLKREITTTNGPAYIELEGIIPDVGYQVARSLCEDGEVERRSVTISYNPMASIFSLNMPTVIHDSALSWAVNIYKEPDFAFLHAGATIPSVVAEIGLSESWPRLLQDKTLWLQGGARHLNAVLVKWNKRANNWVTGYLEVHRSGGSVSPLRQIFPAPAPGTPTQIIINGSDPWLWDLDNLRVKAGRAMAAEGLVPA